MSGIEIETGDRRGPGRPRKELNVADIDRELAQEARASALHTPIATDGMHRRLTDDEILQRGDEEYGGKFDVPQDMVPDGFVYQWFAAEVFGQPNQRAILQAQRNGWREVPASRHPGMWTLHDATGPIEVDGLRLMELPDVEAYNRTRYLYLKARQARQNGNVMLGQAPSGTGPRSHPGVRPTVNVSRETLPVE